VDIGWIFVTRGALPLRLEGRIVLAEDPDFDELVVREQLGVTPRRIDVSE
jgi:hypothetical protein